jgi:hypothetical protein
MSILRVRNKTTNQWEEIQAIKGDTGEQGIQGPKGETGSSGADAKINGVNTINIEAGDNITLEQEENTLTINSTGGGTTDYSNLSNKPKINSVELNGNKSLSDLGVQETLVSGTNIKTINNNSLLGSGNITIQGGGGTSDYSDLTNKPQINSVTLSGNKTTSDLGLGTITSVKMNGSTVATSGEADLGTVITSHQDISGKQDITDNTLQTTNKTVPTAINEVNSIAKGANQAVGYSNYSAMITAINAMDDDEYNVGQNIYIVTVDVPDLWVSSVESTSSTYTYVDDATVISALETNGYIQVGYYKLSMLETQKVDLTNYVENTDYASTSRAGLIKAGSSAATDTVSSNALLYATKLDYSTYSSASDNAFVGKGTLENVIAGKGLVSNTDFANSSTGGVMKTSSTTGTGISGAGVLYATNSNYNTYSSASDYYFIGKGTLENVITGKGLATKSDIPKVFYGTSSTSAGTAAKVVTCGDFTASDLVAGTRITVLFTNANSYNGTATLNINGTGAKDIYYNGTTTNARYMWTSGETVEFIYNGEQWATTNGGLATTTYYGVTKLYTGAVSDSQALALTPRSLYYFANYSIAPFYSASSTYEVGDKVRYSYYLYECNTAITEPESWTEAHWTQIDTLQEQIDNYVNGLNGKMLWTNTSPSSSFAAQNITLSSSDYDVLEIFCRSDSNGGLAWSVRTLKGYGVNLEFNSTSSTNRWVRRINRNSDTSFSADNAYKINDNSTTNDQCVPLYIVGYKTGLF